MDAPSVLQGITTRNEEAGVMSNNDSTARKLVPMPKPNAAPKRRARVRGEGSLFLRGKMFWMELHWKGERFRKSLETTDRETALIKLDSEVKAIRSGELPKTFEPITVQTMYDNWMVEVERTCKPRTIEDYQCRWKVHLKPVFGQLFATQVEGRVSGYLAARKKEGASNITQNRENRILQMIFNYPDNKSKIPADRFLQFPKMHSEKAHVHKGRLSKEDFDAVMKKLEDPDLFWLKVLLTLTFKYGFRKSEMLNAKVLYFDAKEATFTLPPFTTKNSQERVVDIVPDGEIFKMLAKLTAGRNSGDALFHRNGRPVKDYRKTFEKLTKGMDNGQGGHVTIHDLRRSAITGMSNKGVTAAQAGTHLTPDVFNRYIQRSKAERQATAAVIEGD
jgi:integrase